jgi:hypothetical protein
MSYNSGTHVRPVLSGFKATALDISFDEKYLFTTSNVTNTFKVYAYNESANTWTQEYSTTGPSGFGQDVSCTWDGDIAVVGSPLENNVYVYSANTNTSSIWSSPVTTTIERNAATLLYSVSHTPSINFGYSVSLSKNVGNFLAIGAPGDSTPNDHGEVWVLYLYSSINNQLVYKVRTSNSGGYTLYNNNLFTPTYPVVNDGTDYYYITTSGHRIGHSVHISSYGEYLAIGAPGTPVDSIRGSNWFDQTVTNIQHVTTGAVFNDSEPRYNDDYLQSIAMLGHIQVLYSTDSWNTMTQTYFITGNSEQDLRDMTLLNLTAANAWDFPSCGEKVKISTDGTYVFGGSPRYGFPGSQGGAHWGKIESWKREGSEMILSPGRVIGQQPGDRLGKYFDIDFSGKRLACLLLKAPSSYATPYGNFQGGLMVYDFNGQAFFEVTNEIIDTIGQNGNVDGLLGAICISRGNIVSVSAVNGSFIPSFYFKLTQTIDGNTLTGGYLAADTLVIGPNDGTTNNSYPKKIAFGGTYRDNAYEQTQIENRIYHYDSLNYSELEQGYSELIFSKKSQREAPDMIRFKTHEFRVDSYVKGDGNYDHNPIITMNQQGLIKLNAEMHIPDNALANVHATSEMQCNAKALLDIEGDCFTRRRVNIGWPEGQNVYGSDKWSWKIIYDTRSPRIFNFKNSNQIHSNLIAINSSPWIGKYRGDSYGTISNDFRYSETECAFYMHTSSSYSTNDNYNTSGAAGHTISFWFKLTTPQSSLTSNETLMTIGTPSSTANNGMKLELSSTGIIMNFGTHTIESTPVLYFDTNKWYHVYIDFNDDNGTGNAMYINGKRYNTITTGTQPSTTNWTTKFTIGSNVSGDSITDCYIGMIAYGYKNPLGMDLGYIDEYLPTIQDMYKWGPPTQRLIVGGDTIINNHLGIGTVLPAYNLDVVGDINLTGNIYQNGGSFYASPWIINDIIPNTPMNSSSSGGYTTSSSSIWAASGNYEEWRAFNGTVGSDGWVTSQSYRGNSSGVSVHINGVSTTYNGSSSVLGEWIQIQVPASFITNKIDIAPFTISPPYSPVTDQSPRSGKLLGSNDGTTWTLIHSFTGQTYTEGQYTTISFSNSVAYSYFRLVCEDIEANNVNSYYSVYIGEFRIYMIYPDIYYNNANVGIGTISPAYPLDVTGNMRLTGGLYVNGSWGASGQVLTSSGGGVMSWTTVSGGGGGGSSVWTVNGTYAYYNSGNVGIGISTPAYELDVVGDINISSGSRFRINGVAQTFDIDSNNTFTIKTANIERFRIDSNGDTTIGQDNDIGTGHRLTVVDGSTSNDGSYADLVITNMNEHNNARLLLGTPYNIDSTSGFKAAIIADGAGSSSRCDLHFCLDQSSNNTINADLNDSKMVIKYATGNVGIGKTGPGYKLDVNGDINMSTGSSFRINGVAQTFVGASSQWTQSGSNIYRPSGMVGILNTNPSYPLDVTGDINVTGGLHANGAAGTSGQVLTSSGGGAMSWTNKTWSYATVASHPTVTMTSASSGGYVASASSGTAYTAFNNVIGAESWMDNEWAYTGSPTGTYTGSFSTTYNGSTTVYGQWIQLQVPTSITIDSIKIAPQNFKSANAPTEGKILGSTNGSTWSLIHSFTGQTYTDGQYTTISFSNSVAYSYFRLSVERTGGGAWPGPGSLRIGELKFNKAIDTYYSGNVGIGTSSPAHPLDVVGNINCSGTLSKGSGSFKIDHPLANMSNTHNLYHSFIEGPQADLIYRGKVDLENGSASINLDTVSNMTSGTFEALNRNVQCFTSNESDWDAVKGSVSGNMLTISCQNTSSTANVSWLVIGERKDKHMYDTSWTDDDGFVIPEQLK